jgi:glycosyltransferase involved in cell wall biosynthesis
VRVLSILPFPVLPLTHGGRVRAYRLAVGLARAGATVDLCCPWHPAFPRRPFHREGVTIRPFIFAANALPVLLGDRVIPPLLQLSRQPLTRGPRRLLRRCRDYDIVEFHFCAYSAWMPRIGGDTRVVYAAHNVEMDYAVAASPFYHLFARQIEELERRAVRASDLVVACTDADGRRLGALYGDPKALAVLANGFDESEVADARGYGRAQARAELGLRPDELAILFVGGPAVHNRRAARFLEEQVLPVIAGPARLILAGRCARPRRQGRLLAVGFVESLAPLLAAADVAVNPVESGSGSNVKLAEYVAAGVPVVTTSFGLRGYEGFADRVTIAELGGFASAVQARVPMADPPPHIADLGWNALGARLHEVYADLLAGRSRAGASR